MSVKRPYAPIRAPMTGTLYYQCMENESFVLEGDIVVIVEAMKMTYEVDTPLAGMIEYVIPLGQTVESGDIIAKIYPQ